MRPQVAMIRLDVEYPRMLKWVLVMACHGGGGSKIVYGSVFFRWLRNQLLMIEDYAYEGENFYDDLELPLPEGEDWDDRGKKDDIVHVFNFLILFLFLSCNAEMCENDLCKHWTFSSSWSITYRDACSGQRDGDSPQQGKHGA